MNDMQGQGASAVAINSTQTLIGWNSVDVSSNQINNLAVVTRSGGTLSIGPVLNIRQLNVATQNDALLYMQDIIFTGNSRNEYLIFARVVGGESNDTLQAATISGTTITCSTNVPINSNSIPNSNNSFPCMLGVHNVAYPALQFDGSNFGLAILVDENSLVDGEVIFFIESDTNATVTPSSSYGNGSGTISTNTVLVLGVDLSNILIPMADFKIGSDGYTVQSITFDGVNTTITTTVLLITNYVSQPITSLLITQIVDQSSNAYVFAVGGSGISPILGSNGSLSPMICYGNNDDGTPTYLECDNINFPINWNAYCTIVVEATDSGIYLITGVMSNNLRYMYDFQYQAIQFNSGGGNSVGNYTTNTGITMVQCLRTPYAIAVNVNGSPNATSGADCFALGPIFDYLIGSRPDLAVPFAGAIYAVKLRWGTPTMAEITADTNYFISKYGV